MKVALFKTDFLVSCSLVEDVILLMKWDEAMDFEYFSDNLSLISRNSYEKFYGYFYYLVIMKLIMMNKKTKNFFYII